MEDITNDEVKRAALNAAAENGSTISFDFKYRMPQEMKVNDITICCNQKQAEKILDVLSMLRILQETNNMLLTNFISQAECLGAFNNQPLKDMSNTVHVNVVDCVNLINEANDRLLTILGL